MTRHDMTPPPTVTDSGRVLHIDWTGATVTIHTLTTPAPQPRYSFWQTLHQAQCDCGWTHITHDDPRPAARDHADTHTGTVDHIERIGADIIAEWRDDDPTQGHAFSIADCPACLDDDAPWAILIRSRHINLLADGAFHTPTPRSEPERELDLFTAAGVTS